MADDYVGVDGWIRWAEKGDTEKGRRPVTRLSRRRESLDCRFPAAGSRHGWEFDTEARLSDDDVELVPIPTATLPEPVCREWRMIIASAVKDAPGSLTAVLVERESAWLLASFLWYSPGSGFLAAARGADCDALRERVIAALHAAGKPVRHESAG